MGAIINSNSNILFETAKKLKAVFSYSLTYAV
jgi:hypothetical protein